MSLKRREFLQSAAALGAGFTFPAQAADRADVPIALGTRRELFVDDYLIDRSSQIEFRLHSPTRREVVLVHDRPWEGSACGYRTIFRDGERIRMYYKAANLTSEDGKSFELGKRPEVGCYAESHDGLTWTRPELGLFEFAGSKKNNIVWMSPGFDNFAILKDANPQCRPGEEYKAVLAMDKGLSALKSSDGIHWSRLGDKPLITQGHFDSQNLVFWDALRKQYWAYFRDFHNTGGKRFAGIRDIRFSTSPDFQTWSEPQTLSYVDSPDEQLYTNQVQPYPRAPHLFVGFPTRYVERPWSPTFDQLPDVEHRKRRMQFQPRYGTAVTETLFMSSRDGKTFRRWGEAFLRPGAERQHNWVYGDGFLNWGMLETPSDDPGGQPELSFYGSEDVWKRATRMRRYTLRIDGFVSLQAPLKGGEVVTKPLTFTGKQLTLNLSTSAAGGVRVEMQDAAGQPIPGHSLADCDEAFGDSLERVITWAGKPDLSALANRPVRIRLTLRDADLYSLRFR